MSDYFNSEKYLKLIEIIENYEKDNSSFHASGEYSRMMENTISDLDLFGHINSDNYQKTLERFDITNTIYINDLENINKEFKIDADEKYSKDKTDKIAKYNDSLFQEEQDVITRFKKIDTDFVPKTHGITVSKKENKDLHAIRLLRENQNLEDNLAQIQKDSSSLDDLTSRLVTEKQNIKKLNDENFQTTKPILEQNHHTNVLDFLKKSNEEVNKIKKEVIQAETRMTESTVSFNDEITTYQEAFEQEKQTKNEPFVVKEKELNKEFNDNDAISKETSNQILEEFKNSLISADNEISELIELRRQFEKETKKEINQYISEAKNDLIKELTNYDFSINKLKKKMIKEQSPEIEKQINALIKERTKYSKKTMIANKREENAKRKNYLIGLYNYDCKLEILRAEKLKVELFKNNAIYNLNKQADSLNNTTSLKLKLIEKQKNILALNEQYKENIRGLDIRLKRDIENANINNEIENLLSNSKYEEYLGHYNAMLEDYLFEKDSAILDLSTEFENTQNDNLINSLNVKNLLKAQEFKIKKQYWLDLTSENINFINKEYDIYVKLDDKQYNLYTLEHGFENKKLDRNLAFINEKREDYITHQANLERINQAVNENIKNKNVNERTITLYKDRFELENASIRNAFDLLHKQLLRIINFENYLLTDFSSSSSELYENNYKKIIEILNYLYDYEQQVINEFVLKEKEIIANRIDYLKDLRYSKIKENLEHEHQSFLHETNIKAQKLKETINNYNSAISVFTKENAEKVLENEKIANEILKTNNPTENKNLNIRLQNNIDFIKKRKDQIKTNKDNIKALSNSLVIIEKTIKESDRRYNQQQNNILNQEKVDAKFYNEAINNIDHQLEEILANLKANMETTKSWGEYKKVVKDINKILTSNNNFLQHVRYAFDLNIRLVKKAVNNEIKNLSHNYVELYRRARRNCQFQSSIENKNYQRITNKSLEDFATDVALLENEYRQDRQRLNNEIKTTMDSFLLLTREHTQKTNNLKNKLDSDLAICKINMRNFEDDCQQTASREQKAYFAKIDEINNQYKTKCSVLEKEKNEYLKNKKERDANNLLKKNNTIDDLKANHKEMVKNYKQKITANEKAEAKSIKLVTAEINYILEELINTLPKSRLNLIGQVKKTEANKKSRIKEKTKELNKQKRQLN